jgi:hypothetical protein
MVNASAAAFLVASFAALTPTATPAAVSAGLDLEAGFTEVLQGFGLSPGAAHLVWLPLPMLLVLVAAVMGVLVTVWLERKISAAVQQRIGPECSSRWPMASSCSSRKTSSPPRPTGCCSAWVRCWW